MLLRGNMVCRILLVTMIGQTFSHYRIVDRIGAGGMGVVFRAHDEQLGRDVAIKVLNETLASNPDGLARFEREARLLASLNHPNIATLYGFEEDQGHRFLVMELVEGESLANVVSHSPVAPDRALRIAAQIATALEAAHESGIVHRDLKPANVIVDSNDVVKVLDFGLAKVWCDGGGGDDLTHSPTVTAHRTSEAVILGTAAYMSPEQARGKPVDQRADIWAFGCLLYEMLSGRQAFAGETVSDIIASILQREPDWSLLPPATSPAVCRLLRRCLQKDRHRRLHSAADVWLELEEVEHEPPESREEATGHATGGARRLARVVPWTLAIAGAGIALWALLGVDSRPKTPTVRRVRQITDQPNVMGVPALSPDGDTVAFTAGKGVSSDIFVQRVGGSRAVNLTGECELEDWMPAFSPDGGSIAYRSECGDGGLYVMGATGESPRRVTDFGFSPAWSPDGRWLVFTKQWTYDPMWQTGASELWVVELATGETKRIPGADGSSPSWSPDGRWIAYFACTEDGNRNIWVVPTDGSESTPEPVQVTFDPGGNWNPQWSPNGRFLYFLSMRLGVPNLWRVRFDSARGTPEGQPEAVMLPLAPRYVCFDRRGGRLALEIEGWQSSLQRLDINPETGARRGRPTTILDSAAIFQQVAVSPDGKWIAGGLLLQHDLFVIRSDGTGLRRLTQGAANDQTPAWWPDGSGLVFTSDRGGGWALWSINLDGSGLRRLTPEGTDCAGWPVWSPDGRLLVSGQSKTCLWEQTASGELSLLSKLPAPSAHDVFFASWWSPDGRDVMGVAMPEGGGYSEKVVAFNIERQEFRQVPELDGLYSCRPLRDGRRAVCKAGPEGKIVVADLHSGKRTVLLDTVDAENLDTWTAPPSSDWLCLIRVHQQREMYVVDME